MKRFLTVILALLVVFNMTFIFYQSLQDAEKSSSASSAVSGAVADIIVPDLPQRPAEEQSTLMQKIHKWTRTVAHAVEFASLGFFLTWLIFLFTKTEKLPLRLKLPLALGICICTAIVDEMVQIFVDGRAFEWKDMGLDSLGASIGILLSLGSLLLARWLTKPKLA